MSPNGVSVQTQSIDLLARLLADKKKIWVLTGAGISAHSGIPTYRDHQGNWHHNRPIQHEEFINQFPSRQLYWARSLAGWKHIHQAKPNAAHHAITSMQQAGRLSQLVTQNVDRLHSAAYTKDVIDLHGRLDQIYCLKCDQISSRSDYQLLLEEQNPGLNQIVTELLPDGDAQVEDIATEAVRVPPCGNCGGIIMPNVIFYGGNVPGPRVKQAYQSLGESDCVLVVGSSLSVYSGFRFVRRAHEQRLPLYAVNQGIFRGAELFNHIASDPCEIALPELVATL